MNPNPTHPTPAQGTPEGHHIVGPNNQCLCGTYGDYCQSVTCFEISKSWKELEAFTAVEENPSFFYPKGGRGPVFPTKSARTLLLVFHALEIALTAAQAEAWELRRAITEVQELAEQAMDQVQETSGELYTLRDAVVSAVTDGERLAALFPEITHWDSVVDFIAPIATLRAENARLKGEVEEAKNAAREAIAWRELYTAELALDDMDLDNPQHAAAIFRVRNAALGLEAEGNPIPRCVQEANEFAARREVDANNLFSERDQLKARIAELEAETAALRALPHNLLDANALADERDRLKARVGELEAAQRLADDLAGALSVVLDNWPSNRDGMDGEVIPHGVIGGRHMLGVYHAQRPALPLGARP